MKMKEESEKVGLKLNIQKTNIMASGPITSQQIDGEKMETVTDFILGGSKINADGDCSCEIKRGLLLGRKAMTKLDSLLKSRDMTLSTLVHIVKAMFFSKEQASFHFYRNTGRLGGKKNPFIYKTVLYFIQVPHAYKSKY